MIDKVVSRQEWLAKRMQLLQEEKELTRRSDEVAQKTSRPSWVKVEKDYQLESDDGVISLADLFAGRSN